MEFPKKVEIDVHFVNGSEVFGFFVERPDNTMGVFCITNGDGLFGETYYSEKLRIIIDINEEKFKNMIKEWTDKERALELYFTTITHELNHALDYIQNSCGMAPKDVDSCFDSGDFDYSVEQCITGYGHPNHYEEYLYVDESEVFDIMENRVETRGIEMFNKLNISKEIMKSCLTEEKKKLNNKSKP